MKTLKVNKVRYVKADVQKRSYGKIILWQDLAIMSSSFSSSWRSIYSHFIKLEQLNTKNNKYQEIDFRNFHDNSLQQSEKQ